MPVLKKVTKIKAKINKNIEEVKNGKNSAFIGSIIETRPMTRVKFVTTPPIKSPKPISLCFRILEEIPKTSSGRVVAKERMNKPTTIVDKLKSTAKLDAYLTTNPADKNNKIKVIRKITKLKIAWRL